MTEEKRIAVIGGGLAGLAAAAYLARAGQRVTVCERAPKLGGRAATMQHDAFLFNQGAHALYSGGPASHVLAELGVSYQAGIPNHVLALADGRFHSFPADTASLLRTRLFSLGEKLELTRVLAKGPRIQPRQLAAQSVQEWIDGVTSKTRVRRLLYGVARPFLYTAALDLASADTFVAKLQQSLRSPVHYIDGGWQALVQGLALAARQAGAEVRVGQRVEELVTAGNQVRAVRLAGEREEQVTAAVLATTFEQARKLTAINLPQPYTAEVACLDVALRELPEPGRPVVLDVDQPRFMTAQSVFAAVAPAGAALIHTFKQLDARQPSDPRQDEAELEDLLDTAQPGWRDQLVKRVFLPRLRASSLLPVASQGGLTGRPDVQHPDLTNLYLAGDWVGPVGFQVDASLASARRAAQAVLGQSEREPALAA
jgi:phytoene dehydrogenase-like protein